MALLSSGGDTAVFSPEFFLQLGFSFIVGLAIGFALKVAFMIALAVGGVVLISLFVLQFAGLININWTGMEANYGSFADWLSAYAGGLKDFIGNNLSSAASFTGGLLVGLKL